MAKYALLRQRVQEDRLCKKVALSVPGPATDPQIALAHDAEYIERVKSGTLTPMEIRRLGFPWSPQMVERSRRSVGGTLAACRAALQDGVAVNLAGGTHHAFADRGEGFCVFNDSVVAARVVKDERLVRRVVILDCDVHQGNGSAAMCACDPNIFTFSIHGARNYPLEKEHSDLDIGLPDGTDDRTYLTALEDGVAESLHRARADLAIFLAGADPYEADRLGRLAITRDGLAERDRLVFGLCRDAGVSVAVTMSGGYCPDITETVEIHLQTIREAVRSAALCCADGLQTNRYPVSMSER
jgi:acetoin utilization deacetylase AcuC-like enzyme